MKKNNKFVLLFSILVLSIIVLGYWLSQNIKIEAQLHKKTSVTARNDALTDGSINGKILPNCQIGLNSMDAILSQPLPEIWLEFHNNTQNHNSELSENTIKIELQAEAKIILEKYWQSALKYRVGERQGFSDSKDFQKQTLSLLQLTEETKNNLQKITINTPFEKRLFSESEANNLVTFISNAADDVINKIKENNITDGC